MTKERYIVIPEWMVDTGYEGVELISFAIVWEGFDKGWKYSAITKFAERYNIVIPDYIWTAVLRMREDMDEQ
jgi:hypothetical protein